MTTRRAGELVDAQPPPAEEGHAGPRDGQAAAARGSLVLVRDMIQHHPSIMLVIDPVADAIVDANDAALSFYGLTREAFLSAPLCERVARQARAAGLAPTALSSLTMAHGAGSGLLLGFTNIPEAEADMLAGRLRAATSVEAALPA